VDVRTAVQVSSMMKCRLVIEASSSLSSQFGNFHFPIPSSFLVFIFPYVFGLIDKYNLLPIFDIVGLAIIMDDRLFMFGV
jgi:hypothetical protein